MNKEHASLLESCSNEDVTYRYVQKYVEKAHRFWSITHSPHIYLISYPITYIPILESLKIVNARLMCSLTQLTTTKRKLVGHKAIFIFC